MSAKGPWTRELIAPLALGVYGLAVAFWPMFVSGFALMEVDPADTRHLNYVLEHGHRWLTGRVALWSPAFFFPAQNVAAYTEVLLGVVPLYSAWRVLGLAPDSAFQAWMLTVACLNVGAGWLLFRRALAFDPWPAALGAFVVAFGSSRLSHLNHQHLLPGFFVTLAAAALVLVFRDPAHRRRWVGAFFVAVVLQLYAGITLGWFFLFCVGVLALWALAVREARAQLLGVLREQWIALGAAGVGSALALVPLVGPYLAAGRANGVRTFEDAAPMLPQLQSWVYQGPHSWLYGWMADLSLFSRLSVEGEHRIGLGLVTTTVVAVVLWRARARPWVRVVGLSLVTLVCCVMLYRGRVSPWQLVMAVVPGANGIRAVARIALLFLVPAGFALATFAQQPRSGWKRWVGLLVTAFCVLEQGQRVPDTYDKAGQRADVAAVVAAIPPGCRAFFYAPAHREKYDEKTQLDAMWAQLWTGVPTVNGYSSNFPRGWDLLEHGIADEATDLPRLKERLAAWARRHRLEPDSLCLVVH